LTVRFAAVDIAPPSTHPRRKELPYLRLTAILVEEESPPEGHTPVCWWLLTTLPITTLADAEEAVRWYALRWLIERYHYVLKSGCRVERLELETGARLDRALATYAMVAWRLLWLTYEARRHPEASCEGCCRVSIGRCCIVWSRRRTRSRRLPGPTTGGAADRPARRVPRPQR